MKLKLMQMFFGRRNERGMTMIECLVAVAILGAIGVGFLSAMTTSTNATGLVEEKVDIDNLLRAQLEYTKNANYDVRVNPSYYTAIDELDPSDPYAVTLPSDYDIQVTATKYSETDDDMQLITVEIKRQEQTLASLQGIKTNR